MGMQVKPIPGYEKLYSISTTGEVMSLDRQFTFRNGTNNHVPQCILKQKFSKVRGWFVVLSKNSVKTDHTIKSLIKQAFNNDI